MNINVLKNVLMHKDVEKVNVKRLSELSDRYYEDNSLMNRADKKEFSFLVRKDLERNQYLMNIWEKEMKLAGKVMPVVAVVGIAAGFLFLHLNKF